MSKIFTLFVFCFIFSYATPPQFSDTHTFELLKDEWARVFITEKESTKQDSFDFRWSLYDSVNIVIQSFFRNYPRHLVLALDNKRASYLQPLLPDFTMPPNDSTQLLLTFVEFKNHKAKFKVDIIDNAKRVDVEFIDPPKKEANARD